MMRWLRERQEWKFFAILPRADRGLASAWWALLLLRGALPAVFAIAMGLLVSAVQHGGGLAGPLALVAVAFALLQILAPIHQAVSANLGSRVAAYLYDRLTETCVRPPGMGHLEDPRLGSDLTVAREFDLAMTGPPMHMNMDFIAGSMVEMVGGIASAILLCGYTWWAPIALAGAWLATHWLMRESAVWRDRNTEEVRQAQRHAEYAYRLAVDAPRIPKSQQVSPLRLRLRVALFFTRAYARLLRPGLAIVLPETPPNASRIRDSFDRLVAEMTAGVMGLCLPPNET